MRSGIRNPAGTSGRSRSSRRDAREAGRLSDRSVENRYRSRPARGGVADLHREARHREAGRWQVLQIMKLLEMAISDLPPRLVPLPDQSGITALRVFFACVDKGRIQMSAVVGDETDPLDGPRFAVGQILGAQPGKKMLNLRNRGLVVDVLDSRSVGRWVRHDIVFKE